MLERDQVLDELKEVIAVEDVRSEASEFFEGNTKQFKAGHEDLGELRFDPKLA